MQNHLRLQIAKAKGLPLATGNGSSHMRNTNHFLQQLDININRKQEMRMGGVLEEVFVQRQVLLQRHKNMR